MSTEQIRNILDTLQQLDEAEENPLEYEADLGGDSVFVKYISQGKFLISGVDVEGAFINQDGDEAEGWFDFTYDPETKHIEYDNISDETSNAFFDDRLAEETVHYIVKDFFKQFGTDWTTIYKNLKKDTKPFAVLENMTRGFSQKKNEIIGAVRIAMRRSGATMQQIEKIKVMDAFIAKHWFYLAMNALEFTNQREKWKTITADKVGREDMRELLNSIIKYTTHYFTQPNVSPYTFPPGIRY